MINICRLRQLSAEAVWRQNVFISEESYTESYTFDTGKNVGHMKLRLPDQLRAVTRSDAKCLLSPDPRKEQSNTELSWGSPCAGEPALWLPATWKKITEWMCSLEGILSPIREGNWDPFQEPLSYNEVLNFISLQINSTLSNHMKWRFHKLNLPYILLIAIFASVLNIYI